LYEDVEYSGEVYGGIITGEGLQAVVYVTNGYDNCLFIFTCHNSRLEFFSSFPARFQTIGAIMARIRSQNFSLLIEILI